MAKNRIKKLILGTFLAASLPFNSHSQIKVKTIDGSREYTTKGQLVEVITKNKGVKFAKKMKYKYNSKGQIIKETAQYEVKERDKTVIIYENSNFEYSTKGNLTNRTYTAEYGNGNIIMNRFHTFYYDQYETVMRGERIEHDDNGNGNYEKVELFEYDLKTRKVKNKETRYDDNDDGKMDRRFGLVPSYIYSTKGAEELD